MASDITLTLEEQFLKTDAIILKADEYDEFEEYIEQLGREQDDSMLMIGVHRDTGEPLSIILEQFVKETEYAIKMLREYPLPWTFSLPQMGIKEKPLEDILLAIYKKHKKTKMEWE
ncbi:MAG: hypothetical protein AVO39_10205 [delta proteobacterium MLS_D]|nr:MAG: hypothetical protein AVO39_10205 [delta proteobacterium MLS_D]